MKLCDILLVDDDRELVSFLKTILDKEGYSVEITYSGTKALDLIKTQVYSLIFLDVVMPDISGLDICRKIRATVSAPIIFLSAKDRNIDKVVGLEMGADDYITKPIDADEFISRVKAHFRREKRYSLQKDKENQTESYIEFDDLKINKNPYEVFYNNNKLELSTKECQILLFLAENKNHVLSREDINNAIWGEDTSRLNTISIHVMNIRRKMGIDRLYIKTIRGLGYKFVGKN